MATDNPTEKLDVNTTDEEWRERLTPQEYRVLRQQGTEPAFSGEYNEFKADGTFHCRGCDAPLYDTNTKFDSGCGWPSFYDNLPDTVTRRSDTSHGRNRVEILCKQCGGHLGHVFEGEGYGTPTDQRHCVNSLSIRFRARG
jgi:peptide-methionine (R)-S-oxide reductase